jgi:hypothetical protein
MLSHWLRLPIAIICSRIGQRRAPFHASGGFLPLRMENAYETTTIPSLPSVGLITTHSPVPCFFAF